jgi:predicted acyltransferase (DUF342 family)
MDGPAGPIGVTGPTGPMGMMGPSGPSGPTSMIPGPWGPTGFAGAAGPTGPTGFTGPAGSTGPTGPAGAASSVAGPAGPMGYDGPTGPDGPTGSIGPMGHTGPVGGDTQDYQFSSITTDADPGDGRIAFSHGYLQWDAIDYLYISLRNYGLYPTGGLLQVDWVQSWMKPLTRVKIYHRNFPYKFLVVEVLEVGSVLAGYAKVRVKHISSSYPVWGFVDLDLFYLTVTLPGAQGITGPSGPTGAPAGNTGPAGPTGPAGAFGGASFRFNWDTSTTVADPGVGEIRVNNIDETLVSKVIIDDQDLYTNDIQPFLRTMDDSTSTVQGHLKLSRRDYHDQYIWYIINSITEQSGYFEFDVTFLDASSSPMNFASAEELFVTFVRVGDKGDSGPTGPIGPTGPQGADGAYAAGGEFQQMQYRIRSDLFGGAPNVYYNSGLAAMGVGTTHPSGILDIRSGDVYFSGEYDLIPHNTAEVGTQGYDIGRYNKKFANVFAVSGHFDDLYKGSSQVATAPNLLSTGETLSTATGLLSDATGNLDTRVISNTEKLTTAVYVTGDQNITGEKTFQGGLTVTGNDLTIDSSSYIVGDIIPSQSGVYDLGSSTKPYKELWLEGQTLRFAGPDDIKVGVKDGSFTVEKKVGASDVNILNVTEQDVTIQNVMVSKGARLSEDLIVSGHVGIRKDLRVTGSVGIEGDVHITGTAKIEGSNFEYTNGGGRVDWTVAAFNVYNQYGIQSVFGEGVNSSGDLTVQGTAQIDSNVNADGELQVAGAVALGQTLSVTGFSDFNKAIQVGTSDSFASYSNTQSKFGHSLRVDGDSIVRDNIYGEENLYVGGLAVITGNLIAKNNAYIEEDLYVGDTLTVTGETLFENDLSAGGGLNVTKTAYLHSGLYVGTNLTVSGDSFHSGNMQIMGTVDSEDLKKQMIKYSIVLG